MVQMMMVGSKQMAMVLIFFFKWWIDPIEYPELKVVYIYE